jgi:hypothetical protein
MLEDVGHLANHADHGAQVPSLSLSADVELSSPQGRAEFLREVQEAFVAIAERYGAREPSSARGTFHLTLVCYPDPSTVESS